MSPIAIFPIAKTKENLTIVGSFIKNISEMRIKDIDFLLASAKTQNVIVKVSTLRKSAHIDKYSLGYTTINRSL